MSAKDATAALNRAKEHFERASADPDEHDEVFVWSFYALENAVVAASIHAGVEFAKNHWSKAAAARKLSQVHKLADVSDLLSDLNEARKGTAYGDVDQPEIDPADALESGRIYQKSRELSAAKNREVARSLHDECGDDNEVDCGSRSTVAERRG